jgi:hypothetical protein
MKAYFNYDFDLLRNYRNPLSKAYIILFNPYNDTIMFIKKDKKLIFPGGRFKLNKYRYIMEHKKPHFQEVPYGDFLILENHHENGNESIISAAVRNFYETTGIYVYFENDLRTIITNNNKDGPRSGGIYNAKTIVMKDGNPMGLRVDFIPIKFIASYETKTSAMCNHVIFATLKYNVKDFKRVISISTDDIIKCIKNNSSNNKIKLDHIHESMQKYFNHLATILKERNELLN